LSRPDDLVAAVEQAAGGVHADESGSAGDENLHAVNLMGKGEIIMGPFPEMPEPWRA
jgi:hypothetical protein